MSTSHYGSKNSKQTDADGDRQGEPGVRKMTKTEQQDHGDVFYHKQYVGGSLCIKFRSALVPPAL